MNLKSQLQKLFPLIKNRTRLVILLSIILTLFITYSKYVRAGIFVVFFIFISGVSKIYHKFFRSTVSIDLVFFTTVLTALVYNNILLSLIVGYLGLVIADTLGTKFSHMSFVPLISITTISLISGIVLTLNLPLVFSAVVLLIVFDLVSSIFYFLLGSSPSRIGIFLISNFLSNLILIFGFLEFVSKIMV